ncbi:MAG: hypothetical protein JNL11_04120 [Bdellovibrionaceae bacterium]|nr:hypothetical protein [Pseudobdellovibrionaceae bacterium]
MKILTLTFVFLLNLSAFVYVNAKPKAKLTAQPGGQFEVNPSYIKISEDPNKGTYFLDPVNCEMKIIRQNLQISLVKDAETAQENFLIEFPNGRTVIGHIPPEKAKYAACFHSLSNETRPGYRVQVNNHAKDDASHGKDSHSKNTVLSGMDQCLTFAKNPKDQESRVVTNEITYIPNELYCENSNDCWASKSIVRIAKGAVTRI